MRLVTAYTIIHHSSHQSNAPLDGESLLYTVIPCRELFSANKVDVRSVTSLARERGEEGM
jgi:hypothetical protein